MKEQILRVSTSAFSPQILENREIMSDLVHKIGHEIGNPLTAIISLASVIERFSKESSGPEAKTASYASTIIDEAWKVSVLSEKLVLLLSNKSGNSCACNLLDCLERATQRFKTRSRHKTNRLNISLQTKDEPLVEVDPEQLLVLLSELLANAYNYLSYAFPDSNQEHPIEAHIFSSEDLIVLELSNDLSAPVPLELTSLFELFSTAYADKKHLGIGLSMCAAIAYRFDGHMRVIEKQLTDENQNHRLKFSVELHLKAKSA